MPGFAWCGVLSVSPFTERLLSVVLHKPATPSSTPPSCLPDRASAPVVSSLHTWRWPGSIQANNRLQYHCPMPGCAWYPAVGSGRLPLLAGLMFVPTWFQQCNSYIS